MNGVKLIRKIKMECPLCDKIHKIEERKRIVKTIIKGKKVNYEEIYYLCLNSDKDENEFVTGKMMHKNLLNAYMIGSLLNTNMLNVDYLLPATIENKQRKVTRETE